ncbi:hypothetical protein [Clostridium estertheticum]|uniref:hypothetical protein n=1 Tax=Clostridium estertheticum TaxID=238834 RepID=UPI001CC9C299|nr:hypothetical protein [Clostridium estertheticum]MBZ9616787.1 hypothetical protein [Clostridium estertheticum subsp. laramiense]WAG72494.1 hypothetical protein LL032_15215 [Clostridium estertheticum]
MENLFAIGIRTTPSYVYYTVIQEDKDDEIEILTSSKLVVPKSLDIPERLSFIRNCLFSIILEYKIKKAGIRTIESLVKPDVERIYIEGVIQELISNSCIENYFTGKKSKIASIIEIDVQQITAYIDGDEVFAEIDNWGEFSKEKRESIIVAIAATYI